MSALYHSWPPSHNIQGEIVPSIYCVWFCKTITTCSRNSTQRKTTFWNYLIDEGLWIWMSRLSISICALNLRFSSFLTSPPNRRFREGKTPNNRNTWSQSWAKVKPSLSIWCWSLRTESPPSHRCECRSYDLCRLVKIGLGNQGNNFKTCAGLSSWSHLQSQEIFFQIKCVSLTIAHLTLGYFTYPFCFMVLIHHGCLLIGLCINRVEYVRSQDNNICVQCVNIGFITRIYIELKINIQKYKIFKTLFGPTSCKVLYREGPSELYFL